MIKNIYDKKSTRYYHEYYCDCCVVKIKNGKIFRSEFAIDENKFDLCRDCKKHWDENEIKDEENE